LTMSADVVLVLALEKNKKEAEIKPVVEKIARTAEAGIKAAKDPGAVFFTTQRTAQLLLGSPTPAVADIGLEYARKLAKMVKDDMPVGQKLGVYKLLGAALTSRGKAGEAKELLPLINKLEDELDPIWANQSIPFQVEKYVRRKGKSDRVVLVEMFTGV